MDVTLQAWLVRTVAVAVEGTLGIRVAAGGPAGVRVPRLAACIGQATSLRAPGPASSISQAMPLRAPGPAVCTSPAEGAPVVPHNQLHPHLPQLAVVAGEQ